MITRTMDDGTLNRLLAKERAEGREQAAREAVEYWFLLLREAHEEVVGLIARLNQKKAEAADLATDLAAALARAERAEANVCALKREADRLEAAMAWYVERAARAERAEGALRPFADWAARWCGMVECSPDLPIRYLRTTEDGPTLGDLKAAQDALAAAAPLAEEDQ